MLIPLRNSHSDVTARMKDILWALYEVRFSDQEIKSKILDAFLKIRKGYRDPRKVIVGYNNPVTRAAYVLMYYHMYIEPIGEVLSQSQSINEYFSNLTDQKICFIGGGPGPEVYGFFRYVNQLFHHKAKMPLKVNIEVFDRENGWGEYFDLLTKPLIYESTTSIGELSLNFTQDLFYNHPMQFNLIVCQNSLNEIVCDSDMASKYSRGIVNKLEANGMLLIIERCNSRVPKIEEFIGSMLNQMNFIGIESNTLELKWSASGLRQYDNEVYDTIWCSDDWEKQLELLKKTNPHRENTRRAEFMGRTNKFNYWILRKKPLVFYPPRFNPW